MRKTNALDLRQNMGKIVSDLLKTGQPVLIEKSRKPVAVLISLADYQARFVDKEADEKRKELVSEIRKAQLTLPEGSSSLALVRKLRE